MAYLTGSFHMISHAKGESSTGLGRWDGISLIADKKPPPCAGWGIPPWTQKILKYELKIIPEIDTCNYNYIQMDEYQQNGYTVVTMDAYFLINDSCYRHSVKNSICCFPDLFS